jgi:hypothetical protein
VRATTQWPPVLHQRLLRTVSGPAGLGRIVPTEELMANNPTSPEFTSFTLDTLGRYACNTAHEALTSAGVGAGIGAPPPDARPFDVIVVGGGTFGGVFAQHLYDNDTTRSRRILVVERGPYVLPEHVQNLPFMGGLPDWKRPWDTTVPGNNPGLRVCLGGRSLEWGGWSPEPLAAETAAWPATVVASCARRAVWRVPKM